MDNLFDKVYGGLIGQAYGDAWGMPAMLNFDENWIVHNGWITDFRDAPDEHQIHRGFKKAVVTDDTEQALALAQAIIEDGGVTTEGVAREIIRWYDRIGGDTSEYVGPSTRKAVTAMKNGADLHTTGTHNYTNGAAMRISVVGLIHPGDIEGALQDAYQACIPTHNTDVAISGACAIAGAVAYAMKDGVTVDDIVAAARQSAVLGRSLGPKYMGPSVARRIDLAVSIARNEKPLIERLRDLNEVVGNGLPITDAVPAAIGLFVLADGDPQKAAIYGAAAAGDADTVSAMACAIAGAWKGIAGFDTFQINQLLAANAQYAFKTVAVGLEKIARQNLEKIRFGTSK